MLFIALFIFIPLGGYGREDGRVSFLSIRSLDWY